MNVREWALPVYTILMQLATGTLLVLWVVRSIYLRNTPSPTIDRVLRRPVVVILVTILVALVGSHFHLSKPYLSFLAVLNVRHSWLSREIVLSLLMLAACTALAYQLWKPAPARTRPVTLLGWATILSGLGSIYCMSRIYLLPTQALWNHQSIILLFFGSSLLLGLTSAAALGIMDTVYGRDRESELEGDRLSLLQSALGWMSAWVIVIFILVVSLNIGRILQIRGSDDKLAQISISLLLELYLPLFIVRFVTLAVGVGTFLLTSFWLVKRSRKLDELVAPVYLACLLVLVAEILGRFLFYATHIRLGV